MSTPAGIRKPDVFMVPKDVARGAIGRRVRTYYASDLLLVAEVVSSRSGSERTDRVQKVGEYAKAGIPLYWIIELIGLPLCEMPATPRMTFGADTAACTIWQPSPCSSPKGHPERISQVHNSLPSDQGIRFATRCLVGTSERSLYAV